MPNLVTTGALNSGSISTGFGAINNGSSAITTTGTVTFGSLSDGTVTVTDIADEDDFSSNSATKLATQQSIKAYVDANRDVQGVSATGTEINTSSDGDTSVGTTAVAGSDGIVTNDAGTMRQTSVDTFDTYFAGTTKTLTNKTLTAPKIVDGGFIADANGNEMLVFQTASSAVNAIEITNAATSGSVVIGSMGDDSNIDIDLTPKGTGEVNISSKTVANNDVTIIDDKKLYFGTNQDVYLEYDEDGTDKLIIKGNTTFLDGAYDFDIASHDGTNGLKLGGTLVTASAAELNYVDGVTSNIQTQLNSAASTGKAIAMAMVFG
jgi:hypothetical protein